MPASENPLPVTIIALAFMTVLGLTAGVTDALA